MESTGPVEPAPDAVWSRQGRTSYMVRLLLGAVLFGAFTALLVNAFRTGDFEDLVEQVIGAALTVACSAGFVMFVLAFFLFPRRGRRLPGIAVDASGVWWLKQSRFVLVPWHEITAVGVGYLRVPNPDEPRRRGNLAFDVFIRDLRLLSHHGPSHLIAGETAIEPPPRSGLPAERLRHVLLVDADREALYRAVARHAPHTWIGDYPRMRTLRGDFR